MKHSAPPPPSQEGPPKAALPIYRAGCLSLRALDSLFWSNARGVSSEVLPWVQLVVTRVFQPALQLHQLGHTSLVSFSLSGVKTSVYPAAYPEQLSPEGSKNPEPSACETPVKPAQLPAWSKAPRWRPRGDAER